VLRRPRCALFRVTPDYNRSFACPPSGIPHLVVSDFPVLGLVDGQEFVQGLQPPVVIGFQPKGVIDPGAYALGAASGDSLLCHSHQLGVYGCRESPLCSHTFMLHLAYDCRNISRASSAFMIVYERYGFFRVQEFTVALLTGEWPGMLLAMRLAQP
jgi:hypothetical protein